MPSTRYHHLRLELIRDSVVVEVVDRDLTDELVINEVADELYDLAQTYQLESVVLNLVNVRHIISTMIGKLLGFQARLGKEGATLKICNLTPNVAQLLGLMGLKATFHLYATEAEALADD